MRAVLYRYLAGMLFACLSLLLQPHVPLGVLQPVGWESIAEASTCPDAASTILGSQATQSPSDIGGARVNITTNTGALCSTAPSNNSNWVLTVGNSGRSYAQVGYRYWGYGTYTSPYVWDEIGHADGTYTDFYFEALAVDQTSHSYELQSTFTSIYDCSSGFREQFYLDGSNTSFNSDCTETGPNDTGDVQLESEGSSSGDVFATPVVFSSPTWCTAPQGGTCRASTFFGVSSGDKTAGTYRCYHDIDVYDFETFDTRTNGGSCYPAP